uniref:Uncharacterized protein n=1 Tax=Podoviridae sp. ctaNW81 TaxID=2826562 RepID=A0A8S5M5R6_9CAUD|nr:MAG TPA: hypothetical protein [Podoviridae sp. ctaNW81]
MNGVGASVNFVNSYEAAQSMFRNTVGYTDQLWKTSLQGGYLNDYVARLGILSSDPQLQKNLKDLDFDIQDDEYKQLALYTETEKTLKENKVKQQVLDKDSEGKPIYARDNNGNVKRDKDGNPEYSYHTEEISEYEYNRNLLKQNAERIKYEQNLKELQALKDSKHWLEKTVATVGGTAQELALGAVEGFVQFFGDIYNIVEGVINGSIANFEGRDGAAEFEKAFQQREIDMQSIPGYNEWRQDISQWLADSTYLREVDGRATYYGNLISGIGVSFGRMIPSMITGNIAGALGASTNMASWISTGTMYTAVAASNMYELCSDDTLSSTTAEKLLNASLRSLTEMLIEKGLAKALGATGLDALTQGFTQNVGTKTGAGAALARFAKDAMQEGLEEFLQEYSNYFIDRLFALNNEGYLHTSDWNFEVASTAFLSGALMSLGGSFINVLKTKRVGKGEVARDRQGNIKYDKEGRVVEAKFGKLASYEFNINLQGILESMADLVDTSDKSERAKIMEGAYGMLRTLSTYYSKMDADLYNKATALLNRINSGEADAITDVKKAKTEMDRMLSTLRIEQITNIAEELVKDNNLRGNTEIYTRNDMDNGTGDTETLNAIQQIFAKDAKVEKVVVAEHGTGAAASDDGTTIIVPKRFANNPDQIFKYIVETKLKRSILKEKRFTQVLNKLSSLYEVRYGQSGDQTQVLFALLTNADFRMDALCTNTSDVLNFVSNLGSILTKLGDPQVAGLAKQYNEAFQGTLVQYYSNTIYKDFEKLSDEALSAKNKDIIRRNQYPYDYKTEINKGLAKSKNREAIINSLTIKINAMTGLSADEKATLIANIKSDSIQANQQAFRVIENYWYNTYNSEYNNHKYFEYAGQPQSMANSFFHHYGIDIPKILTTNRTFARYNQLFREYTQGRYEFKLTGDDNRPVTIVESQEREAYTFRGKETWGVRDMNSVNSYAYTVGSDNVLDKVVEGNADTKNFLTINDVIYDTSLLKENIRKDVEGKTPEQVAAYLTSLYLKESNGTKTIVQDSKGNYIVGDVSTMQDMQTSQADAKLKKIAQDIDAGKDVKVKASSLFKTGNKDIDNATIVVKKGTGAADAGYDADTNTITLYIDDATIQQWLKVDSIYRVSHDGVSTDEAAKLSVENKIDVFAENIKYLIWHEFRHAIQNANSLAAGMTADFLSYFPKKQQDKIVADLKQHAPEFFVNAKNDVQMANDLLYYSAGGEMQNADIEGALENKFIPFVTEARNGFTVRTPWGSIYKIDANGNATVSTVTEIDRKVVKNVKKIEQQARIVLDSLQSEEYRKAIESDEVVDNIQLSDADYQTLYKMYNWTDATLGSPDIENENIRKTTYSYLMDPSYRMLSLKNLYLTIFENEGMTFEQFLNTEFPYMRTQNSNKVYDNKSFISATLSGEIDFDQLNNSNYVFVGKIKPKDIIGAGNVYEYEILIKPSDLKKADVYRVDTGKITRDTINNHLQNSDIENVVTKEITDIVNSRKNNLAQIPDVAKLKGEYFFYNGEYVPIGLMSILTTENVKISGTEYSPTDYNRRIAYNKSGFIKVDINNNTAKFTIYGDSADIVSNLKNTIDKLSNNGYNIDKNIDVVYGGEESPIQSSTTIKYTPAISQDTIEKAYLAVSTKSLYEYAENLNSMYSAAEEYSRIARRMRFEQLSKKADKIVIDGKEYTYKQLEAEKKLTKSEYAKKMQAKRRVKLKEIAPNEIVRANTISYKFAQGTNLEKYIDQKTHKHPYMDYRLQNLIVATTGIESKLDRDFMNLVDSKAFAKEGVWLLLDYVRKQEYINDATFKLINDNFFHNDNIKNVSQLRALVNNAGMAYALRGVLKYAASRDKYGTINVDEIFNRKMSIEEMQDYVNKMKDFAPDLHKMYEKTFNNYNRFAIPTEKGEIKQTKSTQAEHVNEGYLRLSLLENYDGSLFSYGSAAVWPNILAYDKNLKRAGVRKETSMDTNIKDTKGDNLTLGDTFASQYTTEDMAFTNLSFEDILLDLIDYQMRLNIKKGKLNPETMTSRDIEKETERLRDMLSGDPDRATARWKELVAKGKIDYDYDFTRDTGPIVTETDRSHTQRRIYNMATRIIINKMDVKSAKYRRFYEAYSDLGFTKDGHWKMPVNQDGTRYTTEQTTQLFEDIKAARDALRMGEFDTRQTKTDKERIAKLKQRIVKQEEIIRKLKSVKQTVVIEGAKITLTADKEMPDIVRQIVDTTFSSLSKTDVQNISSADSKHVKKSYSEFINNNPQLATIDSNTATEVINYLTTALPQFNSFEADTKWKMSVLYTYAYINSLVKTGALNIDYELVKAMQTQYEQIASGGGQILNAVQTTLSSMNPYSIALESALKRTGVDLDRTDLEQITTAMNIYIDASTADKEQALVRVQELTDAAYAKALQRAKDSKASRSVINKLIKFRTMAMLSSPGTWLRNITTNILVEKTSGTVSAIGNATWGALNKVADKLGGIINKRKLAKMEKPTNEFVGDRENAKQTIRDVTGQGYNIVSNENELAAAKEMQADLLKEYDYLESRISKTPNPNRETVVRRDNILNASQMLDADIKFYLAAKEYSEAHTKVPLRRTLEGQYEIVDTLKGSKYKLKENKDGTYYIEGVVVNKEVTDFILNDIFNNGLFDQIKDGISKYDTFDTSSSIAGNVTAMIIKGISSKLFYNNQFNTKSLNWLAKSLYKVLSDEKWVNRAFVKYLAATLTEDKVDLSKGVTKEVMGYIADAFVLASADYMHKSSFIGDVELKFRERFGEKAYAMWKFIFPFANASWNWFAEGLRWTPFGLAKSIYDFARFESTVETYDRNYRMGKGVNSRFAAYLTKRNIGKGIVGSIGFVVGIIATALGVCGVEEDKKDKKTKIRIGDVYIDFSDVFGTTGIGMGLILGDAFANKERFFDAMVDTLDYMFDDSIFSDVYDMVQYKQSFAEVLLDPYKANNILASFIPNLLKTITSSLYIHEVKYDSGFIGTLERIGVSVLPGLAYGMPKQYDAFTGELQYKYTPDFWGVMSNIVNRMSSLKVYPRNISALEKEVLSLGLSKGNLTGKYADIGNLSPSQVSKLNEMYGQLNNKYLLQFMQNKIKYLVEDKNGNRVELYYRQMTKEQRKSVVNRIMTNNAKMAKVYVWTSEGHKYYTNESFRNELVKNGIRAGVYLKSGKTEGFKD